jgi:hypothetical protein
MIAAKLTALMATKFLLRREVSPGDQAALKIKLETKPPGGLE